MKPKTTNMNKRKRQRPWYQLHLITKSHGSGELRFADVSSAAQFTFKKWCRTQMKLFVNGKFTERHHFFCAWLDLISTSFVCSLLYCEYSCSQVTQSFLAVCSPTLGYAVQNFCTTDAKYVMFRIGWHKPLKSSATPDICWKKCQFQFFSVQYFCFNHNLVLYNLLLCLICDESLSCTNPAA